MDDKAFEDALERLRRITDGEETYGEGRRYDQGTKFYLEHLVVECARRARAASPGLPAVVDLLVSTTGHSPRLAILAYLVLEPKRLVVIPSHDNGETVNTILQYVYQDGRLTLFDAFYRECSPTDPVQIYEVVRGVLTENQRHTGGAGGETIIDITAGRKVMGASAALAAWQLDVKLCYLDGDYVDGRAIPGSDRVLLLDNPSELFGETAMTAARQAFTSGAFEAAQDRFEELAGRLAQPALARFMSALSALYRDWCNVDMDALPSAVERVNQTVGPARRELPPETVHAVYTQLGYLQLLVDGDRAALFLCFSLLSDHYRRVGRHDFAALFSYRVLEACFTARLADLHSAFDGQKYTYANYEKKIELRAAFRRLLDEVDNFKKSAQEELDGSMRSTQKARELPNRPEVFGGAALLSAMGDPVAREAGLSTATQLHAFQGLTEARNKSVLAHGIQPVGVEVSERLHEVSLDVMRAYWTLSRPGEDLDGRLASLTFISAADR
jgi:CRISPR-associated protein (TIGR02710 family)